MRIFMLVQHPSIRGPLPKLTAHLVAALRSLGCTVETHPWGRRSESESLSEKVVQRFQDILSVRRVLRRRDFDIAVVQTAHDWRTLLRDISVVLLTRRHCRPVVLQLHGSQASRLAEPGSPAFKLVTAGLLALVDGIMVLSTEEQHQWQVFRPRPPVFTVKNPYVRAHSPVDSDRGSNAVPDRPLRLLFVGRLIEEKGVLDLVEALALVVQQQDCHLVVVGEGELERKLSERIRRLGLEGHVRRTGYLTGTDLNHEYRSAAIFVLPTSWAEGFPTVLAEAMDAGLAIVTTPTRGARDYLVEDENALFARAGDVRGLAASITTLLGDADLRARMGAANQERVQIFAPDLVAAEYLQILQSVVTANDSASGAGAHEQPLP
jgi:glycosyltransferase involved in cell wall biosynthesis